MDGVPSKIEKFKSHFCICSKNCELEKLNQISDNWIVFPTPDFQSVDNLKEFTPYDGYADFTKEEIRGKIGDFVKNIEADEEYNKAVSKIDAGSQMFFVSNYPVEWFRKNDVPLSFLGDVCRYPMKTFDDLQSYLDKLKSNAFSIDDDILKETWIVMCSPDDPNMHQGYFVQMHTFEEMGFKNYKIIYDKNQLIEFLDSTSIKLLIVDSHGSYNSSLSQTEIRIGPKDWLKPEDVKKLQNTIPLVFLCACFANPPQKFDETIAEAFLEKGSFSVTSTYMAMDIYNGMQMICRIINSLRYNQKYQIHRNWLDFIAHLTRSVKAASLIKNHCTTDPKQFQETKDLLLRLKGKLGANEHRMIDSAVQYGTFLDLMPIEQGLVEHYPCVREEIYQNWLNNNVVNQNSEMLFYSHLGRPDLAMFKYM